MSNASNSPNSPKPPISDDIDDISKHRLSPITPTLKHDNTQRFPVRVLLICDFYKKDGYRQQNVRQRQKLISIVDYDVCILEYLQPIWRYSTSKNGLTLKSGYGVLQGH